MVFVLGFWLKFVEWSELVEVVFLDDRVVVIEVENWRSFGLLYIRFYAVLGRLRRAISDRGFVRLGVRVFFEMKC